MCCSRWNGRSIWFQLLFRLYLKVTYAWRINACMPLLMFSAFMHYNFVCQSRCTSDHCSSLRIAILRRSPVNFETALRLIGAVQCCPSFEHRDLSAWSWFSNGFVVWKQPCREQSVTLENSNQVLCDRVSELYLNLLKDSNVTDPWVTRFKLPSTPFSNALEKRKA